MGSIYSLNYWVRSSPENRGGRVRMLRAQGRMSHNRCGVLETDLFVVT